MKYWLLRRYGRRVAYPLIRIIKILTILLFFEQENISSQRFLLILSPSRYKPNIDLAVRQEDG